MSAEELYVISSILSCHTRTDEKSHPAEILTEAHLLLRRSLGYDLKGEINRIRNELPNGIGVLEGTRIVDLQKIQDFYGIYHSLNKLSQKKTVKLQFSLFRLRWISYYFRYNLDPFSPRIPFPQQRPFRFSRCPQLLSPEPRVAAIFSDEDPPGSEPCNWTATGLVGVSRDRYPSRGGVSQGS